MDATEFRGALAALELTQVDLGRLVSVTPRGVNLWAMGEREVPGPVAAYLGLLLSLPRALQVQELSKLHRRTTLMEGLYSFHFDGAAGSGYGTLVLMGGRIFGSDGGVVYDGTYAPTAARPDHIDLVLQLTVPPGVDLVQGVPAQATEYKFGLKVTVPARQSGKGRVDTPFGPVEVRTEFLRDVPRDLAA